MNVYLCVKLHYDLNNLNKSVKNEFLLFVNSSRRDQKKHYPFKDRAKVIVIIVFSIILYAVNKIFKINLINR